MTDTLTQAREIPLSALPEGAAQPQLPDQAHIYATAITAEDGAILAYAVLRQRRTALVAHISAWSAPADLAAALAEGVKATCAAHDALLIRALPEQAEAIAALGLEDTGRNYAQLWLSDPIPLAHPVGQYNQSTGFTCGPVSIAMAMGEVTRDQEIEIWREATTMIGLNGPGGCDPYGMLLAATNRGFTVEMHFDAKGPILIDRAQTPEKAELMSYVQNSFKTKVAEAGLEVIPDHLTAEELGAAVRSGAMVILLIDQHLTHDHHAPHWILLHAEKDGIFLVNDPWLEPRDRETRADVDCIPMRGDVLHAMGAYGDTPAHGALILR